eukprot:459307_1
MSMKPDRNVCCSIKKLQKGQKINLQKSAKNAIKFKKIQYVAIYISSNQHDTEQTLVNFISFIGIVNDDTKGKNKEDLVIQQLMNEGLSLQEAKHLTLESMDQNKQEKICEINKCDSVQQIIVAMKKYDINEETNDESATDVCNLLNDFTHLLTNHNDDTDFESIFNCFERCDPLRCTKLQRHYRDQGIHNRPTNANITAQITQELLFDKLHCYLLHSFDTGYRLTAKERAEVNDEKKQNKDIDTQLIQIKHILRQKEKEYKLYEIKQMRVKKFVSNYTTFEENEKTNLYWYSYPFNYWSHCKSNSNYSYLDMTYSDLYISPKFESLKAELIQNTFYAISIQSWRVLYETAILYTKTISGQQCCAKTDYKYIISDQHPLHHAIHAEISDGSPITVEHLISLIIYCKFETLQYELTKTYRPTKQNEWLSSIKKRHSNFCHFAKALTESVTVFGTEYMHGSIGSFYHVIDKKMGFRSMSSQIFSPLSTSSQFMVASQFAKFSNLIIELVPDPTLKYFKCDWLSPFPCENEILFIGGIQVQRMHFSNIINVNLGQDYQMCIRALRLIDTMAKGSYFMYDHSDVLKFTKYNTMNVALLSLQSISSLEQEFIVKFIHHELHRSSPNEYKPLKSLSAYIDALLHQICNNRESLIINWNSLNIQMLPHRLEGGYIGYKFLSSLLVKGEYPNMLLLNLLFPMITTVKIFNLPKITKTFLDDIVELVQQRKTIINYICLELATNVKLEMEQWLYKYHSTFQNLKFKLQMIANDNRKALVIQQISFQSEEKNQFKIVVGIDFGTDGSGLAYAIPDTNGTSTVYIHDIWKDAISTEKPKTSILFDHEGNVQSTGNPAVNLYINCKQNKGWKLFERFKMSLYEHSPKWISNITTSTQSRKNKTVDIKEKIRATNGNIEEYSEVVFVACLKWLKSEAMKFIDRLKKKRLYKKRKFSVAEHEIKWILTVPAIWSEKAKQKMKDWAIKAGLIKSENDNNYVH